MRMLVIASLAIAFALPGQPIGGRLVDLGHPMTVTDPTWSGKPDAFSHTVTATIEKTGIFAGRFTADEHFGTHVDAPAHFAPGKWTVDQIPVERLMRPGHCINVTEKAAADEDYQVTHTDITEWEARHGEIREGAIVLIATGWDARWPAARYMNVRDGVKHFPGLTEAAALLLARDRRVAAIGIDTPSVDYGPSTTYEAHRASQPLNVYHVENARGLTALPASGFEVIVAPANVRGGSGAPARVFARLPR